MTRSRPLLPALLLSLVLGGCEGDNLFVEPTVQAPTATPVTGPPPALRYVEEGTLLQAEGGGLRFRWEGAGPIGIRFDPPPPARERAAIERAARILAEAGAPQALPVPDEGAIVVRTLAPDDYRTVDPTRPWSFSRSYVTADAVRGITEVEIFLSLALDDRTLERAALHAFGHAMGIMGHPAFPGEQYVMAARPPDDAPPPTDLAPVEVDAFRFLYSPGVSAGMSLEDLREAFERWAPGAPSPPAPVRVPAPAPPDL